MTRQKCYLRVMMAAMLMSSMAAVAAAAPERVTIAGINNFWHVDDSVSTGGTITSRDMAIPQLTRRGIRTVINLAGGAEAEAERAAVEAAGMKYFLFAIDPAALDRAPVDPLLKAMHDPANFPIFVHSGGGHRAAAALMLTRVLVDGWTIEKAGIEAASAGMVLDNDMAPVWWKFIRDTLKARGK